MLIFRYDHAGSDAATLASFDAPTASYTQRLQSVLQSGSYEAPESSLLLPSDAALLAEVQRLSESLVSDRLRYHIVVGIGGSNLGTKAVYDALRGYRDSLLPQHNQPCLFFAETTNPQWLTLAGELLRSITDPAEVLISIISKSGGTTETVANFEMLAAQANHLPDLAKRIVAITDQGSALWEAAEAHGFARLSLPKPVGGRYSVLSAVGLFPLITVGIDIVALRRGAAAMRDQCLANNSVAARSAQLLATQKQQGKTINDNFFFEPQLESLGKWYRQLMGESIGKAQSLDGQEVHQGITPTVSLGSTDLHSVGQLYLGGPTDKFTTFVSSAQQLEVIVPEQRILPELIPAITGKSAHDIMSAILQGVQIAYQKAEIPFMEIILDRIDEESLGAYLQFKMLEMMYLGVFLQVNSFDQPSVESYKIETKRILGGN